ncbi:MAG: hypothetical protein Kow0069_28100 [Promethearchaeota archaeon]
MERLRSATSLVPGVLAGRLAALGRAAFDRFNGLVPRFYCPACGTWTFYFRRFGTRRWAQCRVCGSLPRHRTLAAFLTLNAGRFARFRRFLEVSPSVGTALEGLFRRLGARVERYEYADLDPVRYESFGRPVVRLDLQALDLPFAAGSFDVVVCCHVLEHVPDEEAALGNLHRLLALGGVALVQVPVDPSLPVTEEWDAPDPSRHGHVRQYGADVADRFRAAGFRVTTARFPPKPANLRAFRVVRGEHSPIFLLESPPET